MMDEKRLEEEYREMKCQAAPDLWERIEAGLKEHPERRAEMEQESKEEKTDSLEEQEKKESPENREEQEKKENRDSQEDQEHAVIRGKFGKRRRYYGAAAAAAAVVILAAVRPVMNGSFFKSASEARPTMAMLEMEADEAAGMQETVAGAAEITSEGAGIQEVGPAEYEMGPGSSVQESEAAMAPGSRAPETWKDGGSSMAGAAADESMQMDSAARSSSGSMRTGSVPSSSGMTAPEIVTGPGASSFNTEEYSYIEENGFRSVAEEPVSTFSADVDTAAYSNIRRMLLAGQKVPADAVRIEEMINYFDYDYPEPEAGEPFSVTTEYVSCPWNSDNRMLMIGLQAKAIDFAERPASNLVFLLDVSGSMRDSDKLPLMQKAFAMLAENLTEDDRVSIVTYSGYETVALDGVPGNETAEIVTTLEGLEASGSTAGAAGIQKAYELARRHYIEGGNNRVIMATDGDLNVGISSEGDLVRLIEEQKQSGVHLSVLGVGTGNLKDNKLEALADHGDGNYHYIDSVLEAKKVLVDEMGGTLVTVAKDVKLQVEFNPEQVSEYRLIGYENRVMAREDFDDDQADAGEIGAGHTVTALYEIVPADGSSQNASGLKYQKPGKTTGSSELLTVSLRYKEPDGDTSKLLEYPVEAGIYRRKASDNLTFAAAVAEFGMILRDSEYKENATYQSVLALAESCVGSSSDAYRKEFLKLVEMAERIDGYQE